MNQKDIDRLLRDEQIRQQREAAEQQRMEQEQQAAEAEAARQQQEVESTASEEANESNNEGLLTKSGKLGEYILKGGPTADAASLLGDKVGVDIPNYEETQEIHERNQLAARERIDAGEGSFQDHGTLGMAAVSDGSVGGVLAPVTIAGRVTNQDTPWSRAPKAIKDHALYDTIFQVTEVMVPSLIFGAVGGKAVQGAKVLVAESALETALQDDLGETITGELLADNLGKIATSLGHDGEELAADLKSNRSVNSVALRNVVGFFENLGINFGVNQVLKKFTKGKTVVTPEAERAAAISGKNPEKVQQAIDNVSTPEYKADYEPSEVIDVDTVVPVSKPTGKNISVSEDALRAEMLRDVGILDDGLTSSQRSYFSNYKPLAKESGIQKVIQEVTKSLKKLPDYPSDLATATLRAETFWNENKNLIDENLDDLVIKFADNNEEMVRNLDERWDVIEDAFGSTPRQRLRNATATTPAGDIVGALIGEELGIKIQKQALAASNLENVGIDFTDAVNTLVDLQEVAENFFIPLRRARRQWAIGGKTKQRKTIESIKDGLVVDPNAPKPATLDSRASNFTRIRKDDADVGKTLREIWNAAQAGDEDALTTLKDYINYISYTNPRNVVEQVDNLSQILADEWAKGNTKAASNIFYGYMLSRVSTQVASIASNISRLALEPVGAMLSGEQAYGLGQMIGGLAHWQEAMSVGRRAFAKNAPINGGSKVDTSVASLKEQQLLIERNYQGLKAQAIQKGEGTFLLDLQRTFQMAGTNPLLHAGTRFLMTADEVTKSLVASQVATGRAFKEAAETGVDRKSFEFKRLIHKHFNDVYLDGVKTGVIKDKATLDVARNISFQRDIPRGPDASMFDNLAASIEDAAKNSAYARFFVPFTRVSWNIAETGNRLGVGVGYRLSKKIGDSPLGDMAMSTPIGRFASERMFPRYRAIMEGNDEAAKIQLKSHFAMGEATAISAVGLASLGMLTGYNSGQLPQTSILVPAPGTTTGYIAINYSKLEPFASLLAFTADGVNSFRYGAISRGEYSKVIEEVTFSFGMSTLNKTFLTGIADLGEILNIKNMNKGSAATLASSIASLSAPAAVRMVGQILYPYKTLQQNDGSIAETMLARINARATGGVGNPIMHSPLTGKPVPRSATIGGDGYWNAVLGSLVNEFGFPGKVNGVDAKDPVINYLNEIGFEYDSYSSIRNVNGVALSLQEQSYLARDMGDPEIGNLKEELKYYFENTYDPEDGNGKKQELERLRKAAGGQIVEGTDAYRALQEIRADIRKIYQDTKQKAASEGELGQGDGGQAYRQKIIDKNISTGINPNEKIPGAEGLVAWAMGEIPISQVG